jgi:hypothetical protein
MLLQGKWLNRTPKPIDSGSICLLIYRSDGMLEGKVCKTNIPSFFFQINPTLNQTSVNSFKKSVTTF